MKLDTILNAIAGNVNIAEMLSEDELHRISVKVMDGYELDNGSRISWEEKMKEATKLAMQVKEHKNFPFENSSNVKFPLITIACLQSNAEEYPALVRGNKIVKMRVIGADEEGIKAARAQRISDHMSYQILEEDEAWEDNHDSLLMVKAIMGAAFKKTYFNPLLGHNVSEMVFPNDLVIPYHAKSVESARRMTHIVELYGNDVRERVIGQVFLDIAYGEPTLRNDEYEKDENEGLNQTEDLDAPHIFLEQHRYLDLDDDGYEEPYIVTVHKDTAKVVRIQARFDEDDILETNGKVLRIDPVNYFTRYLFIPSPDGGIYGLGLGLLLGPINDSVNTILNLLIDSGKLNTLQAGFLGRGVRLKSGNTRFQLGEWKRTDSIGDDLRKQIMPLPTREPSQVLMQLLDLLINYGQRLSSTTDMQIGESPGQNQPATTSMAVLEQGKKVIGAIFKRSYRSMKSEFRKLYRLNSIYLDPEQYFEVLDTGDSEKIFQQDYLGGDPKDIRPVADPALITDTARIQKAEFLANRAQQIPGYNRDAIERQLLEAVGVENVAKFYNPQQFPPPGNPKAELEKMKLQLESQKLQMTFRAEQDKLEIMEAKTDAEIDKMEAESILFLAQAQSEKAGVENDDFKRQIDLLKIKIGDKKNEREAINKQLELMRQFDESRKVQRVETEPND